MRPVLAACVLQCTCGILARPALLIVLGGRALLRLFFAVYCNALATNGAKRRRYYCNSLPASHALVSKHPRPCVTFTLLVVVSTSQPGVFVMTTYQALTHNPCFVVWPLELGLGTHNPRVVAWPLELGVGTHSPDFVAWPLELVVGTHSPDFVAWALELGLGTHNPCFVAWPLELGLGTHNPRLVAWPLELGLGTDQAVRGGRHGQKLHSGFPLRQVDAHGSADAGLS